MLEWFHFILFFEKNINKAWQEKVTLMMACSGRVGLAALAQASLTFVMELRGCLVCIFNQPFSVFKW